MKSDEPSKIPLFAGLIFTGIWVTVTCFYMWLTNLDLFSLDPGQFGSFMAGICAPLGVAWLIVAFLQQAQELRLQIAELSLQVKATTQMANAAMHQQEIATLSAQPIFQYLSGSGQGGIANTWEVVNKGSRATNVHIGSMQNGLVILSKHRSVIDPEDKFSVKVIEPKPGWFEINYTDGHSIERSSWHYYAGTMRFYSRTFGQSPLVGSDLQAWLKDIHGLDSAL